MKPYQLLLAERERLCKTDALGRSWQSSSGDLAGEQGVWFAVRSCDVTPRSCEDQTRGDESFRDQSEAEDTRYIAFNRLSSTSNILDSL